MDHGRPAISPGTHRTRAEYSDYGGNLVWTQESPHMKEAQSHDYNWDLVIDLQLGFYAVVSCGFCMSTIGIPVQTDRHNQAAVRS